MPHEGLFPQIKRLLVGEPIPSHLAHHERLSRVTGLAVLSSDALSSVAYATEAILLVLIVGGRAAFGYATPISLLIATLLLIVVFSYRQTIFAYPNGGGAYIVAKENISQTAGLVAAAALLIDYTLTVAVSIAAGVAAVTSAVPEYHVSRVELSGILPRLAHHEDFGRPQSRPAPLTTAEGRGALLHRLEVDLHRPAAGLRRARGTAIFCRSVKYRAQGSALSDARRRGRFWTVYWSGRRPRSSSSQASGAETGAPGRARVE